MGEGVQTVERSPLKISSTCDKEQIYDVALTLRMDNISSTSAGGQFLHIASLMPLFIYYYCYYFFYNFYNFYILF